MKVKKTRRSVDDLYALVPTRDMVPIPGTTLPIYINKGVTADAVQYAIKESKQIVLSLDQGTEEGAAKPAQISRVGTVAAIVYSLKLSNGDLKVRLRVDDRVKILSFVSQRSFLRVRIVPLSAPRNYKVTATDATLVKAVRERFGALAQYDNTLEDQIFACSEIEDPGELADIIAAVLPLDASEGQRILEELHPGKRLRLAADFLNQYVAALSIRERAASQAQESLGRASHQELLREQIRQIQAELGEDESIEEELDDLKTQLKAVKMPEFVRKEAEKQLRRLQQLHPDTSEAALARTYLDWILDLPWGKRTRDRIDLAKAKAILDEDHFGLDKPKERMLDFLGVGKLRKEIKGPILLFVGPPGVGKTSLGRSIARALGRRFIRASVGGLRDEAELRGHRRTYVGALPGRIIQSLKLAGTKNPVFMLDELDKIGSDFRGDPASVLLEILDPEQNKAFEDHYLNIPFDLSEVMFIGTANITDTIPSPLLDRMEIIELPGYTTEEKLQIAKRYLVPKEKNENGLRDVDVEIPDKTIEQIIVCYTRESGVRELGRFISTVFRKVARMIAEGEPPPKSVNVKLVERFLGPVKFLPERALEKDEVGIVNGLAWTPVGGEMLTIEASITPGKGALSLTGQLGEVMRESAQAALTFVQSNAARLGIEPHFYESANVHIHVPQGAIQKDGPSAGVGIAIALISLLTNTPVSRKVAMTGEITLRGNVLAIGGLREKALAALRIGATTVIIPKDNEREIVEFPDYLRERVTFVAVEHIDHVLPVALVKESKRTEAVEEEADVKAKARKHEGAPVNAVK